MISPQYQQTLPLQLSGIGISYSPLLCYAGASLKNIHKIWQRYVRGKKMANSDNWFGLAIGYLANYTVGSKLSIQLIAGPFLVAARVLDLFEQEDRFVNTYKIWKEDIKGNVPIIHKRPLERPSKINFLISRYRITRWKQKVSAINMRINRVFKSTVQLIRDTFTLVMCFMDVLELCSMDQIQVEKNLHRAVEEGGINIPRVLDSLCNNRISFLLRLDQIESTLKRISPHSSKLSISKLIDISKKTLDMISNGLAAYKSTSIIAGEAANNEIKEFIYQFLPDIDTVPITKK